MTVESPRGRVASMSEEESIKALVEAAARYADDFARGEGDFDLLRAEIAQIVASLRSRG